MIRRRLLAILLVPILVAACAAPGVSPGPSSAGSRAPLPSVTSSRGSGPPSPTTTPHSPTPSLPPTPTPTPAPSLSPTPTVTPTTTPSATPGETMIVRAYFLLDDRDGGDPALVPVLRTVPERATVARSALRALLGGPSSVERGARPRIRTLIPEGTALNGIRISGGLATVDLSTAFASGSGSFAVRGRLAQVVYTLTQFPTVDRVAFELDGVPVTVFSSEGIMLDEPVTRATYRNAFLPAIFVDRPAWGAALPHPGRVAGLANVFEAEFRIALLDRNERVLVDQRVSATCGTGCWGRFDVALGYEVPTAQWGTLRVYDTSERDGSAVDVREYPIWLPAGG